MKFSSWRITGITLLIHVCNYGSVAFSQRNSNTNRYWKATAFTAGKSSVTRNLDSSSTSTAPSCLSLYLAPSLNRQHYNPARHCRGSNTALHMGLFSGKREKIKSFLKKIKKGKDGDKTKDTSGSSSSSSSSSSSGSKKDKTLQEALVENKAAMNKIKNVISDYSDKTNEKAVDDSDINDDDRQIRQTTTFEESTQERINRVKAGQLTEEEKAAFLRTALSSSNTAASRPPLVRPDGERQATKKKEGSSSSTASDSLTPDSILHSVASRSPSSQTKADYINSERKKREFLEMVNDPNRFKRFPTASSSTKMTNNETTADTKDTNADDDTSAKPPTAKVTKREESDQDLAVRLAAHAETQIKLKQENEKRQEEIRRQEEKAREAEIQRQLEIQRQRNEEIAKREIELKAKQKEEEELKQKAELERRRIEEEKQKELIAAQDAYWAKKVEKSKAEKEKEAEQRRQQGALEAEESEQQRVLRLREEERQREDPHEGEILKEAAEKKLKDRENAWKITETVAERQEGYEPPPLTDPVQEVPDVSLSSFLGQQAKQRNEIDRQRNEQLNALKSLNSPLPTPRAAGSVPVSSPPPASSPSSPAQFQSSKMSITDLLKQKRSEESGSASASGVDTTGTEDMREDSDAGIDNDVQSRGSASPFGSFGNLFSKKTEESSPTSTPPPPQKKQVVSSSQFLPINTGRAADPAPPPPQPLSTPIDTAPKRKVIRQQIPISGGTGDGGDTDDFNDYSKNGPKKDVSIGDAMKQAKGARPSSREDQEKQSRMWGIDMSKYKDID